MDADDLQRGRVAAALTAGAFLWAVFLVVRVAAHRDSTTGESFVAEYGLGMLALFAIPAGLVAIAWFGLHRACSRGSAFGHRLGWTATIVLLVFSILGGFSIGFLAWYSAMALIAAAALTPLGEAEARAARCGPAA